MLSLKAHLKLNKRKEVSKMKYEKTLQYLKEDLAKNIRQYQELIDIADTHNLNNKYYLGARNATMYILKLVEIYENVED